MQLTFAEMVSVQFPILGLSGRVAYNISRFEK